jgi:F-type H+-transporting ATPase subunit a
MDITTDAMIYFQWRWITLNATIVNTWIVMVLLSITCWLITRRISTDPKKIPRFQHALEIIVGYIRNQIREITEEDPAPLIPLLGALFLYISISNFLGIVPYYYPPTGSFSTTAALAVCVFLAVPFFGIWKLGLKKYLKQYFQPTPLIFPFKLIGEITRTFALAVRLFGNIMSGTLVVLVLLSVAPLFLPIFMQILGLLIGQIQAYIFAVLATIFIASGMRTQIKNQGEQSNG